MDWSQTMTRFYNHTHTQQITYIQTISIHGGNHRIHVSIAIILNETISLVGGCRSLLHGQGDMVNGGIRAEEIINLLLTHREGKISDNHSALLEVNAVRGNGRHTDGKIPLDSIDIFDNLYMNAWIQKYFFDLVEVGIMNADVSNRLGILFICKRTWTRPLQHVLNTLLLLYPAISLLDQILLVDNGI